MSTFLLMAAMLAAGPDGGAPVPGAILAQQGGQQARAARSQPGGTGDAGQNLVDLIQTHVAPSTWQRRGGPGTIYFWRPSRALVVRNTDDAHDQVGGLLEQLRRAGQEAGGRGPSQSPSP